MIIRKRGQEIQPSLKPEGGLGPHTLAHTNTRTQGEIHTLTHSSRHVIILSSIIRLIGSLLTKFICTDDRDIQGRDREGEKERERERERERDFAFVV